MRVYFIILLLFFAATTQAQCVDKYFIDQQIRAKFPGAHVDSVRVYIINGKYFTSYDSLALTTCLNSYSRDQITFLYFSKVKECGYQPGYGTIYIGTEEFNRLFREKLKKRLIEQQKNKSNSRKKASR